MVPAMLSTAAATATTNALAWISTILANRLTRLASSDKPDDVMEALTAAVYLLSSASNQLQVSRESRIRSFKLGGWDRLGKTQTIEAMVESGFYCLGEVDHVKCFFCDLGLRDWERGDVPEMEHVRFSPLCFFLKSSRSLDWLRTNSQRPPNFPTSYTRQDHNQLLRQLHEELTRSEVDLVCKLGFPRTKVLLCVARKFIRFRQKFTRQDLLTEMHKEWDRYMSGEPELFPGEFELAEALDRLMDKVGRSHPTSPVFASAPSATKQEPLARTSSSPGGNRCRSCVSRDVELVCLPCGHLSLCGNCGRTVRRCPAVGCGDRVDSMVRAFGA